jgi:hypothetical protein
MIWGLNISGLHSSSFLRAEYACYHETPFQTEDTAVVADPILFWKLLDPIAALVDGNIAKTAENDHVFVLVVTTVTYDALCVFLGRLSSKGSHIACIVRLLVLSLDFILFILCESKVPIFRFFLLNLAKNFTILVFTLLLLGLFNMSEKLFLLTRRVGNVEEYFVKLAPRGGCRLGTLSVVVKVPVRVLVYIPHEARVNLRQEILTILFHHVAPVNCHIWLCRQRCCQSFLIGLFESSEL